jgi:hypothetical protein
MNKIASQEIGCEGVGRFHLAQNRHQWQALINRGFNLWAAQNAGNFLNGSTRRV